MKSPQTNGLSGDVLDAAVHLIAGPGRVAILPMTGESMLPTLRAGQRVAVELALERPERGDLLLFRQVDYYVVHRYLGPASGADGKPCLRTRGDHMPRLDSPLDPERVLGRVVAIEEEGGWLDLDSGGARLYGLAVALHDLVWSVAVLVGGKLETVLGRPRGSLRERVAGWDRALLARAHRIFLRLARRRPRPA